jgi:hypothetical protein
LDIRVAQPAGDAAGAGDDGRLRARAGGGGRALDTALPSPPVTRPVPGTMGAATFPLLPPRPPTNLSSCV